MWFAGAEEVEVGAVEEEDAFGHLHFFFLLVLVVCFEGMYLCGISYINGRINLECFEKQAYIRYRC